MRSVNGNIRIGEYSFDKELILGKGATGNVYKGTRNSDGSNVAVKAIEMINVNNEVTQYLLQGQKRAMREIKHKNVVKCLDIIQESDYCFIVMQQCACGTLRDYIKSKGQLAESEAIPLFRKIVSAYCSVIDSLFIHRDLKTANIMLRYNNEPAIIDFGYCEMIMGKRPLIKYNVGSPSYMSPEAYEHSRYSEKSDVWALGVILYEMLTGRTLDQGYSIKQYFEKIKIDQKVDYGMRSFSELVNSVFQAIFTMTDNQRASCHKIKYLFDKNLGPMMDLSSLPPGAIIKPMNSGSHAQSMPTNYIQSNQKYTDYKSKLPLSLNYSTNRNPLLNMNFNLLTSTNQENPSYSFKTPNGTPLRKQFIKKTQHNPNEGYYIKHSDIKFKGKQNLRRGSYNQQLSFQFDMNHRSNDVSFRDPMNKIFARSKISSANQKFESHLFEAQGSKRPNFPQVTQFMVPNAFQQSSANSQVSIADPISNDYSLFEYQRNSQNINPVCYSKAEKQRVVTVVQDNQKWDLARMPPRMVFSKKNNNQVLQKVVSECPRTFGSLRII